VTVARSFARVLAVSIVVGCQASSLSFGPTAGSTATVGTSDAGSSTGAATADDPSVADLYAQSRCGAIEACGCDLEPFTDRWACETSMRARFLAMLDGLDTGSFDFSCFAAVLDAYDISSCETHLQIRAESLAPPCLVVSGDADEGDTCQGATGTMVRGDTCGPGLRCAATITGRHCIVAGSTDHVAALGQPCAVDHAILAPCETGTYCDVADSDTCVPWIEDGSPCQAGQICEPLAWCDVITDPEATVCVPRVAVGAACTSTTACQAAPCIDGACGRVVCHDSTCSDTVAQVCFTSDL
jgi:hypothetical protein